MNRTAVESSNILSVGYQSKERRLEVEFHNNAVYQYSDVPMAVWTEIMRRHKSKESIGKYFNANVRNTYKYERVFDSKMRPQEMY